MCMNTPSVSASTPIIASTSSAEANQAADVEAYLRRRRGSAAGRILTSARGIPATSKLGASA